MRILRNTTWLLILFINFLLSCNNDDAMLEDPACVNVKAKEVLIDFVDIYNHHLGKDRYDNFSVVSNDSIVNTYLVEEDGNTYLGFKPVLPLDLRGANIIKHLSKVYLDGEAIAVVESTFRLDSVRSTGKSRMFFYTNTENNVLSRPAEPHVRLLVGEGISYREEGQARFCVVFNFPKAKVQPTDTLDYGVKISGFLGQTIKPIQKGVIMTGNPDNSQSVTLAIEGIVHNYYDAEGKLQESYDIIYEIVSLQLFGNKKKHIIKVTNSGDCYSNKIQACSFDGQQLNLASVVAKHSFGGEYINLTIK